MTEYLYLYKPVTCCKGRKVSFKVTRHIYSNIGNQKLVWSVGGKHLEKQFQLSSLKCKQYFVKQSTSKKNYQMNFAGGATLKTLFSCPPDSSLKPTRMFQFL